MQQPAFEKMEHVYLSGRYVKQTLGNIRVQKTRSLIKIINSSLAPLPPLKLHIAKELKHENFHK